MPIQTIDRPTCSMLRDEINAALRAVAERHGIQITAGNAKYSATNVEFKVNVCVVSAGGVVETKERQAFRAYCRTYGLKPEDLDKVFVQGHRRFKIAGLKTTSARYPVLAQELGNSGKTFKFPASSVAMYLSRQAA